MVNNDFIGGLINVVYYIIYTVIAAIIIYITMWLFVKSKGWYASARIKKIKEDFLTEAEYIIDEGEEPSSMQKFFLSQTGIIEKPRNYIFYALCVIGGGVLSFFVYMYIYDNNMYTISLVIAVVFSVIMLMVWIDSLKALKSARILLFLFYSFVLLLWIYNLFNSIINWIQ